MSGYTPTLPQIKAQLREIREKFAGDRIIGLSSSAIWEGPNQIEVDGEKFEILQGISTLQIRERLLEFAPETSSMVLLTSLSEDDLGNDITARLAKERVFPINAWDIVKCLFRARHVDPLIVKHRWIADTLIEHAPVDGYRAVAGGILDGDTVWGVLLEKLLGLKDGRPDATALLTWLLVPENGEKFQSFSAEIQDAVCSRIRQTGGEVGASIMRCVCSGHGASALSIGLVCRVVFGANGTTESNRREAAVRLEKYNDGQALDPTVALAWAKTAEAISENLAETDGLGAIRPLIEGADALLAEILADKYAYISNVLLTGFQQRLNKYGESLTAFLKNRCERTLDNLEECAEQVFKHHQAKWQSDVKRRAEMALRLSRWLVLAEKRKPVNSFSEAAQAYMDTGSFVDWARRSLLSGEDTEKVAQAYESLRIEIGTIRETENKAFAKLLAEWVDTGSSCDNLLVIENVLDEVVASLGEHGAVLLIVMDGMSAPVFRELVEDIVKQGWMARTRVETKAPLPVIAAIPSVTEVSRASLLAGKLTKGDSSTEKQLFKNHSRLAALCSTQSPPLLLHKNDLSGSGGTELDGDVRKKIASQRNKVIGAVINVVDDHLLKGDQTFPKWTTSYIPVLHSLLQEAQQAGRTVVLTSDHGHVLDHQTVLRQHDDGERWRRGKDNPESDEIVVRGSRVVMPTDNVLIAPWSESVRYGMKKNGYHGGVTPQEMVVPLAILAPSDQDIDGFTVCGNPFPQWWFDSAQGEPAKIQQTAAVSVKPALKVQEEPSLFDINLEDRTSTTDVTWIDVLMESPVFASQEKLVARAAPPREQIRAFLVALESRGGKLTCAALARSLDEPVFRINGLVAVMRRLLNVDGYSILERDEPSDSVSLNRSLLQLQFELDIPTKS